MFLVLGLCVWVPFLYGGWLSYLLLYIADSGKNKNAVVGVLVIWAVITTFVYLVARIASLRCMTYQTMALPLFALQLSSDLFTEVGAK